MKSDIQERFFKFVDKQPGEEGCWNWTGHVSENGYGKFWVNDEIGTVLSHRWSFMMTSKKVLEDEDVLDHLCRNRACVRPSHLDPVSLRTNTERGQSVTAENRRKDACSRGHSFTEDNTYRNKKGGRQCRQCMRDATRRYAERNPDRARVRVRRYRERNAI